MSAMGGVQSAILDVGGAVSIIANGENDASSSSSKSKSSSSGTNDDESTTATTTPGKDYETMHRVMSRLPPEELDRFGGLPETPLMLTSSNNGTMPAKLTEEQHAMFEARMEELWNARQEELKKAHEGLADLPGMLRERILTIKGYLDDVEGGLGGILEGRRARADVDGDGGDGSDAMDDNVVRDVVDALRDLEYLLSDVDMARDFHTLGGWPPLVSLLDVDDEERRLLFARLRNVPPPDERCPVVGVQTQFE